MKANLQNRPLTKRQSEILEYLRKHIAAHGCPPSSREICRKFGFAAPNAATGHLKALELNGEATVKRIYKTRRGYRLQPENKSFNPIEIEGPQSEGDPIPDFRIGGPVVGVVRLVKP